VAGYCATVVGDEDSLLLGGDLQHLRVSQSDNAAFQRRCKVDGWLAATYRKDDVMG